MRKTTRIVAAVAAFSLLAAQYTMAAPSLEPPELMDDPGKQMIVEPTFIASLNSLCGFILVVEDGEVDAIVTWRMPAGQRPSPEILRQRAGQIKGVPGSFV